MTKVLTRTIVALGFIAFLVGSGNSLSWGAERHPMIHAAHRKLQEAKVALEKAAHDFGGHRVKAIEHINQALEELKLALEYDAAHEGGKK